jgi:hypothetical protein
MNRPVGTYAELTGAQAPVETRPAQSEAVQSATAYAKTFRVIFVDKTYWQAFILAHDAKAALEIAEHCWCEAGTEGFTPEQRLDIARSGSATEFLKAEEVRS